MPWPGARDTPVVPSFSLGGLLPGPALHRDEPGVTVVQTVPTVLSFPELRHAINHSLRNFLDLLGIVLFLILFESYTMIKKKKENQRPISVCR